MSHEPAHVPVVDRDQTATDLDRAIEAADAISTDRDLRADTRDQRADTRDRRAEGRDGISRPSDANAESDRSAARLDRQAAAGDRTHAKADREAAGTDRRTSAAEVSTLVMDDLTGSYLRGPGMGELGREVIRAKRTGQAFVLVFIDVDGLKATNDTFGHQAGDRVLTQVAKAVRARVREYDVVVRYGGDEFICGLLDCNLVAARQRFEQIDADLAASGCAAVSSGVAQLKTDEELDDLIARADQAMYDQRRTARR